MQGKSSFSFPYTYMSFLLHGAVSHNSQSWGILSTNQFGQHLSNAGAPGYPGPLPPDLYAVQLWVLAAGNIILFCCTKSSSLLISLSPFSATLRQWNFLLNEWAQLLEGENRVFVLLLLSTRIQSPVPPLGRTGGWLAGSLTEGEQCSGKLNNRIKIYGATGIPSKLAPPVKTKTETRTDIECYFYLNISNDIIIIPRPLLGSHFPVSHISANQMLYVEENLHKNQTASIRHLENPINSSNSYF